MSIWRYPPSTEGAEITLANWRVIRTSAGNRHVVGNETDIAGRISSKITGVNADGTGYLTASGTTYRLDGPPAPLGEHNWLLRVWCPRAGISSVKDITHKIASGKVTSQ